jgi:hypothetical protein
MCRAWLQKTCPEAIRGGLLFGARRAGNTLGRIVQVRNCEAPMDIVKCSQLPATVFETGQRLSRLQESVHKNSIRLLNSMISAENSVKIGAVAIFFTEKCKIIVKN